MTLSLPMASGAAFFSGAGPTDILGTLLPTLDAMIVEINTKTSTSTSACLTQTPVPYTINVFGEAVPFYAQCYYKKGTPKYVGDPAYTQFGTFEGVTYIYSGHGVEWIAATVTPTGSPGQYVVKAWIGLGYTNTMGCSTTWDGCSYGAMILTANSSTNSFEFAVAGMGLGYCGAQLKSDGTNIYAEGSTDMGTTCTNATPLCVLASDAVTAGSCGASVNTFSLTPLGRKSTPSTAPVVVGTWAESEYPATPNITLNGTASDDLRFGPLTPTSGVGEITN